ncbi:LysR family transcriptional regulator [Acinetobacter courvalinii]|uniref:LysR family transcriptional regulator n=1 Tax=Acinetobacter courvalinii TaxID=280147 RepID=UPI0021D14A6A|nr:LysR family transcriptional regulator [Acinetobacter courvalinii]MCU4641315.1 LysR family transcriptional regulator [Acinetobacter courvalinii]
MDIRDLKTFIYVVDNQSITVASEKLGVNQSTVTKRIYNMEEILKGVLFNRKTRPLQLTSLGEKVYFKGCFILKQLESLENFHHQADEVETKKIRIGLPQTLVDDLLDFVLYESKKTDLLYDIDISSGWGRSLIQQIQNEEIDLATFMIPSNLSIPPDLLFTKIGTLEFVVVCKKGEGYKYTNLEKCSKKGWILHPEGCCFRESLANLLYERNLGFYINREIFGLDLQLQSILRGEGLGVFPKPFFDKFVLKNNRLERIQLKDFPLYLNVGVVKSQSLGNEVASSFFDIVKKHYF